MVASGGRSNALFAAICKRRRREARLRVRGRLRWLLILDVEPSRARRRLAATATRAFRIAERQSHLEREVGAQEVRKIGAIGPDDHSHLVLAQAEVIEQHIARAVAQHLVEGRPGRRRIERRIKQFLDPRRVEVFRRAIPFCVHRPDAPAHAMRLRRLAIGHRNVAGNRAACARPISARQCRVPRARGRRSNFRQPEIRRPALAVARLGGDTSIRRDQGKLTVDRLFGREDYAQRRALPGRHRRRQDRDLGRRLAVG